MPVGIGFGSKSEHQVCRANLHACSLALKWSLETSGHTPNHLGMQLLGTPAISPGNKTRAAICNDLLLREMSFEVMESARTDDIGVCCLSTNIPHPGDTKTSVIERNARPLKDQAEENKHVNVH